MPTISPLKTAQLHAKFDPERIPWEDSRAIPLPHTDASRHGTFQPRALQALNLALSIKAAGYNVYLSGEPGLGRQYMLTSFLGPVARKAKTPSDIVYLQNFRDPDQPKLFQLPAGQGERLRHVLKETIEKISRTLSRRFDDAAFVRQQAKLMDAFQKVRLGLLQKMNEIAQERGFNLDLDENGNLTLYPLSNGKRLSDAEVEKLDSKVRLAIKKRGDNLVQEMSSFMRRLAKAEETLHADERDLEQAAMRDVLDSCLAPVIARTKKACGQTELDLYFQDLREDLLKNTEIFLQKEAPQPSDSRVPQIPEDPLSRYDVNVIVDNSRTQGAPIIIEDHPTAVNLLGCVERVSEMGALVTNFTLIKAGSLHKANGGFLIVHIDDLLQHINAFEGLLRALRSSQIRIEDIDDMTDSTMRTKGINPEPLPLNLKVILIGGEILYETLLANDERFAKLFRIKAHMTEMVERTAPNIRRYLSQIARIIKEADLRPFNRTALAWLVDHGCHLSEDQRRLSLQFPLLRELMIEADARAAQTDAECVSSQILEDAYGARAYRANLVEETFMEEYDRDMIKVTTTGTAVGQTNGLAVTTYGDFEFGLPHRISCTVGVGQEGIIDLEREAELGGPIHTKAMMILKSFLINRFASKKPLVLSGSLYFEQSYAGIEGDSASGAELVALLSALAEVPVRLDLAFTGAVSHTGQILPVGGVTRKIEGFFKVCAHQGLSGTQGVIVPKDNVVHLMLAPEVLKAVEEKKFSVYPVRSIEEALLLLTGMSCGKQRKDGSYTKGSLYDLVDHR
ncbi:MAG: AAA family ATPase, partial [Desulfovibrio sp.]|nr:AAA family ATPase [Desulfovibrio sp.]